MANEFLLRYFLIYILHNQNVINYLPFYLKKLHIEAAFEAASWSYSQQAVVKAELFELRKCTPSLSFTY